MNESQASERLLDAFMVLGLSSIIKDVPGSCIFDFHKVDRVGARSCVWEVKDSILQMEVYDTDIESGVRMVVATFTRLSLTNDSRISVRYSYLPSLLTLLQVFGTTLALLYSYILSMNELSILLGIFGIIASPILLWWKHSSTLLRDEEFVRRIARTSSMDPLEARQMYSHFIAGGSLLGVIGLMLLCEFIFVVLTLFPLLFPVGTN